VEFLDLGRPIVDHDIQGAVEGITLEERLRDGSEFALLANQFGYDE
jgi:hypothetical protein